VLAGEEISAAGIAAGIRIGLPPAANAILIGIIARLVLPVRQRIGVLTTVLVGIGGAHVGGIVVSSIGEGGIYELNSVEVIVGIIAAVGLIAVAEAVGVGDRRPRRV